MIKYTITDILTLHHILCNAFGGMSDYAFSLWAEVLEPLKKFNQKEGKLVSSDIIKDFIEKWAISQKNNELLKKLVNSNEAHNPSQKNKNDNLNMSLKHFIFEIPFNEVPLFINDPYKMLFVRWRLQILK